jgi:hypothetical protein
MTEDHARGWLSTHPKQEERGWPGQASGSDAVLRMAMSGHDERANRPSLLREAGFDRNLSQVSDYFSPNAAAN